MTAAVQKKARWATPTLGMRVAFKAESSDTFAGLPARITQVWRMRSGDYLVTLKLEAPVRTKAGLISYIDAFMSELCSPAEQVPHVRPRHNPAPQAGAWR